MEKVSTGIGGHQSRNMRTEEWLTPPEILTALGTFDLDPCSPVRRPYDTALNHFTIIDNGLIQQWFGRVWLNPPYGNALEVWMKKMSEHLNGIALIFARTETQAFHKYIFPFVNSIFFFEKRIAFHNTAGIRSQMTGGAPSVLCAYGDQNSEAIEVSGLRGKHIPLQKKTMIIVVGISATWLSVIKIALKEYSDTELKPLYDAVEKIAPDKVMKNKHWKEKVRQTLHFMRREKIQEPASVEF